MTLVSWVEGVWDYLYWLVVGMDLVLFQSIAYRIFRYKIRQAHQKHKVANR